MAEDSIYDGIDEFRLVDVDGISLTNPNEFIRIREPEGFGDLQIILERAGRGGFDFEYGSDDTRLGFDGFESSALATQLPENTGRYLIEEIYGQAGTDMNIKLQYFANGNTTTPIYEGFLVGSSYEKQDYATFFRVKRFDFGNKIKTRFDAVINLEETQDLDGNPITPLALRDFALHSLTILDKYAAGATLFGAESVDQSNAGLMTFAWTTPIADPLTNDGFDGIAWFLLDYVNNQVSTSRSDSQIFTYSPVLGSFTRPNLMAAEQRTNNFQIQDLQIGSLEGSKFFTLAFNDLKGTITVNHSLNVDVRLLGSNSEFTAFIKGRVTILSGSELPVLSFSRAGNDVTLTLANEFDLQIGDKIVVRGFDLAAGPGGNDFDYVNGIREITNISGNDITFVDLTNSALSSFGTVTIEEVISETETGSDSSFHDTDNPVQSTTFSLSDSQDYNLTRGQRLYFYYTIEATGIYTAGSGLGRINIDVINEANLEIDIKSQEIPSICSGSYFNETLDKALQYITGDVNILESTVFQNRPVNGLNNGCGGLNITPTGFKIRQRDEDLRVVVNELLSFAQSRFGCGWAIYYDNGTPKMLLEKDDFFHQDKKIITLSSIYNPVVKRINKDILCNELLVGFEKFARPNEEGTSEGFSTQSEYLTPIEKDQNRLQFLSKLIGDGTEIERVRRNGIEASSDQADEKDDDAFSIKIHEFGDLEFYSPSLYGSGDFLNIQRDATNQRIIINGLIITDVAQNDFINIDGATNRQISGTPVLDLENNRTILPCSTETQDDIIFNDFNFRQSDDLTPKYTYNPERIEGFSSITGLIDERTVYNLDHANTQFLFWNFGWFGGCLSKKDDLTDSVKFLTKKAITTLQKNYNSAGCGLTTSSINERDNFLLGSLRSWNPEIFNEFVYELDCQLSFTDLLTIKEALRNESVQDINYGYIEFTDNDGSLVNAFPVKITYNPVTLQANFILWGKA